MTDAQKFKEMTIKAFTSIYQSYYDEKIKPKINAAIEKGLYEIGIEVNSSDIMDKKESITDTKIYAQGMANFLKAQGFTVKSVFCENINYISISWENPKIAK